MPCRGRQLGLLAEISRGHSGAESNFHALRIRIAWPETAVGVDSHWSGQGHNSAHPHSRLGLAESLHSLRTLPRGGPCNH